MWEIVFFWLLLSLAVAILAETRGRHGFAWFIFAVILSPFMGFIFVMVLPNKKARPGAPSVTQVDLQQPVFVPDGIYGATPYRVVGKGEVEAFFPAGIVRFRTMEQFVAAEDAKRNRTN